MAAHSKQIMQISFLSINMQRSGSRVKRSGLLKKERVVKKKGVISKKKKGSY